jgi:hypothetical protein
MAQLVERLFEAYKLLGVSADSPLDEITRAYRKLAKKFHPDSNPERQTYAHEMMMKINEAYTLVKDSYGCYQSETGRKAGSEDRKTDTGVDRTLWAWILRFERQREEQRVRQQQEMERKKKENEALKKFWEKIIQQRQLEIADQKTHETIKKYAFALVSEFYKKNYPNILAVQRRYLQNDFEEYIDKFKCYMKKIRTLAGSSKSKGYRKKSTAVYNFLKSFILDAVRDSTSVMERRASAFESYGSATRDLQKFLGSYFSGQTMKKEELKEKFSQTLMYFEDFLSSYQDSPLIEYAKGKIEIMENFFFAYMKE